jgi:hypothetical protein
VYVWVDVMPDGDPNAVHPQGEAEPYRELIEELRDRVRSLEEANRENRRIIAALTQRIPELEAPASPEPPGSPETASEEPERAESPGPVPEGRRLVHNAAHGGGGCSGLNPARSLRAGRFLVAKVGTGRLECRGS